MPKTKAQPKAPSATPDVADKKPTKIERLVDLLRRPEGARLDEMMQATGWQSHSVRGALAGALKKKLGLCVSSEKTAASRVYRVTPVVD
jgi:hypothetical protein